MAKVVIYELRVDYDRKFYWSLPRIRAALKKQLPPDTAFRQEDGSELTAGRALCTRWWQEELAKWGIVTFYFLHGDDCRSVDILNHEVN